MFDRLADQSLLRCRQTERPEAELESSVVSSGSFNVHSCVIWCFDLFVVIYTAHYDTLTAMIHPEDGEHMSDTFTRKQTLKSSRSHV